MKIVCVDDNEAGRYLLEALLRKRGHEVKVARNGGEALEIIAEAPPDLILSDILMPELDGYELCRAVRGDPRLAGAAFVFYTAAYTDDEDVAFGESLGADAYLFKPAPAEDLLAALDEAVRKRSLGDTGETPLALGEFESKHGVQVARKLVQTQERLDAYVEQARRHDLALHGLADHSRDLVAVSDRQGRLMFANPVFYERIGVNDLAAAGKRMTALLSPERYRALLDLVNRKPGDGPAHFQDEIALGDSGPLTRIVGLAMAVHYRGESALLLVLREEENLGLGAMDGRVSNAIVEAMRDGLMVTDKDNLIVAVNAAFTRITGYAFAEVEGRNPRLLKSDRQSMAFYQEMWAALHREGTWSGEVWNRRKDGGHYLESLFVTLIRDLSGAPAFHIGILSDLGDSEHSRRQIEYLALHDPLTDLPNRAMADRAINEAIATARRQGAKAGMLYLDLDRFKTINDSFGHPMGDELLRIVAKRLRDGVRSSDTVCRLGGDEFMVILGAISDRETAGRIAEKLLKEIARPISALGHALNVTPSIGVALFPEDGETAETLIHNSDSALYLAKECGRNNFQYYDPALGERADERVNLEISLRHALPLGQLYVVYQPQVDLNTGVLTGCEALLRWRHPELGIVSPAKFIPVAEEAGLIHGIGLWALETACRQMVAWRSQGLPWITVAVNLSALQFRDSELPNLVEGILGQTGARPEHLELELTESVLMKNVESALAMLARLKKLGIRLAVDDFGTGYSNLAYLKRMPVDTLKIDMSFVRDLPADPNDAAIVAAITQMAASLKLETLAEGVETEAQRDFLTGCGCRFGQGYWYSRPLSPEDFGAWVSARRSDVAPPAASRGQDPIDGASR